MNIKEAEKLTGISKRNIRFYEQKGMLHPARNQDNDYRDYSSQDIERLKLIRALRMVDMPLEEIQKVLDGKTSLEDAATAQERQLRERVQEVQTAIRFCKSLQGLSGDVEVDAILREMDREENRKHLFTQWREDYKKMCKFLQKATFTYIPEGAVTNAREFTQALLDFARENQVDITITKEGMYPEFTLNGVEYTAERLYTQMGRAPVATVRCAAKHPETLEPDLPAGKKRAMKLLHFAWIPLVMILVSVMMVARNGGLPFLATLDGVVLGIVFPLVVGVMLYRSMLFYYNNKNK